MKLFIMIIGTIALVIGVKLVYDARPIVKKYFNEEEKKDATSLLKILGFLVCVIGSILVNFAFYQ